MIYYHINYSARNYDSNFMRVYDLPKLANFPLMFYTPDLQTHFAVINGVEVLLDNTATSCTDKFMKAEEKIYKILGKERYVLVDYSNPDYPIIVYDFKEKKAKATLFSYVPKFNYHKDTKVIFAIDMIGTPLLIPLYRLNIAFITNELAQLSYTMKINEGTASSLIYLYELMGYPAKNKFCFDDCLKAVDPVGVSEIGNVSAANFRKEFGTREWQDIQKQDKNKETKVQKQERIEQAIEEQLKEIFLEQGEFSLNDDVILFSDILQEIPEVLKSTPVEINTSPDLDYGTIKTVDVLPGKRIYLEIKPRNPNIEFDSVGKMELVDLFGHENFTYLLV